MMTGYDLHEKAAAIVRDAGGKLVGRTRLQKVVYLSQLAGFAEDFPFEYRHYGPFSEELADAMEIAAGLGLVHEDERKTEWGGWYSVYSIDASSSASPDTPCDTDRNRFVTAAANIGAIELELAATAAFLCAEGGGGQDGNVDPWEETAQLKPEKAGNSRLIRAKAAYRKLRKLETPKPLPPIV